MNRIDGLVGQLVESLDLGFPKVVDLEEPLEQAELGCAVRACLRRGPPVLAYRRAQRILRSMLVSAFAEGVSIVSIGKGLLIDPKVVPSGTLSAGMLAVAEALSVKPPTSFAIDRRLKDGSREDRTIAVAELDGLCDLTERFTVGAHFPGGERRQLMVFAGHPGYAEVQVHADDATTASAMLAAFFSGTGLNEYVEDVRGPEAVGPEPELEPPSGGRSEPDRRLTIFLSHRFTPANASVAAVVQAFLNALGVEVVTGQGYEPRSVSAKVAQRLSRVDAVVLLIGADGESPWTRDEVATAHANGAAVIPIVEEGAAFLPGLFADLEYITFQAGHVGDAFLSLAQAVQYIRVMGNTRQLRI